MTDQIIPRKPRLWGEIAPKPVSVTFDDGNDQVQNFPWGHYTVARRSRHEADVIRVIFGDWLVVLRGRNLDLLYQAIEEQSLIRLRAQPELDQNPERSVDAYVVEIRFLVAPETRPAAKSRGQGELPFV